MKKLPVFVFPISLEFYLAARHTHKQLLTLYNPYEFAVNFKVLCTSPHKFTVIDPEGVIAPQSCVDIVVRYSQSAVAHCNSIDKFRISMQERDSNQILGKRDVPAKFLPGEPDNISYDGANDNFQPMAGKGSIQSKNEQGTCTYPSHRDSAPNLIAVGVGVGCIIALLLPTYAETQGVSALPGYLHLSVHLKLVMAFVLGLPPWSWTLFLWEVIIYTSFIKLMNVIKIICTTN